MKQTEIRKTGYRALVEALGVVGTLRFLQQLDTGTGNYTQDRHENSQPTLEEFRQFALSEVLSSLPSSKTA